MIVKQIVLLIGKPHKIIIQSIQVIMLSSDHTLHMLQNLVFSSCIIIIITTKIWNSPNFCLICSEAHTDQEIQKSLKREDLEVFWLPSQCCMWTPMASKYKLLLPWKPTTLPSVVVEVKNFPNCSPYGPYWPRLVWNVSDFMIVCPSSLVIGPW